MKKSITESDLRAEWDRLMPVERRTTQDGMTCLELAALWHCARYSAREQVNVLIKAGKLKMVGVRPGLAHAPAYELVRGK